MHATIDAALKAKLKGHMHACRCRVHPRHPSQRPSPGRATIYKYEP